MRQAAKLSQHVQSVGHIDACCLSDGRRSQRIEAVVAAAQCQLVGAQTTAVDHDVLAVHAPATIGVQGDGWQAVGRRGYACRRH